DEIKKVLQNAAANWLTAAQVRDRLVNSGFDLTLYASNPLASVSTTLRRMKPQEVESSEIEGVAAYRLNQRRAKAEASHQHQAGKTMRLSELARIGGIKKE